MSVSSRSKKTAVSISRGSRRRLEAPVSLRSACRGAVRSSMQPLVLANRCSWCTGVRMTIPCDPIATQAMAGAATWSPDVRVGDGDAERDECFAGAYAFGGHGVARREINDVHLQLAEVPRV